MVQNPMYATESFWEDKDKIKYAYKKIGSA